MTDVQLYNYNMGPDVVAFSTTRKGGYSTDCYASFNINCYCGDSEDHILRNRELLCRQLGISDDRLIMPHQTHETRVACIDETFLSLSTDERQQTLEGIDALMTNISGVCIGVSTADCIPLLLYDPQHHAVCAIHAGWRGTMRRIVEKAVQAMTETYATRPSDLIAQIAPGISLDSFEVGQEVCDAFAAAGFEMSTISKRYPANVHDSITSPSPFGERLRVGASAGMGSGEGLRPHIDLPECNRQQLLASGLLAENITDCGICTYQHHDTFFSARRLGIQSGRIFTGILLK